MTPDPTAAPLTDAELDAMRARVTDSVVAGWNGDPWAGRYADDVPRLLAEVARLRAEYDTMLEICSERNQAYRRDGEKLRKRAGEAEKEVARLRADLARWDRHWQARSRGFHDYMEGKPESANPHEKPANVEDETSERAWWQIGWNEADNAVTRARLEEDLARLEADRDAAVREEREAIARIMDIEHPDPGETTDDVLTRIAAAIRARP